MKWNERKVGIKAEEKERKKKQKKRKCIQSATAPKLDHSTQRKV
jgi:hypothetical protein